jgi:surface antigen
MRLAASIAGVLVSALIFIGTQSNASAFSLQDLVDPQPAKQLVAIHTETNTEANSQNIVSTETNVSEGQPEPQPVTHTVAPGESLTKIATIHQTTWRRLFDKNTQLANPDIININDVLVVPAPDEVIAERPLSNVAPPEPANLNQSNQAAAASNNQAKTRKQHAAPKPTVRSTSAGNGYVRGYCTWYAKNRRPDLPNNLGNANTWVSRARAQGLPTGSAPQAGAIGQQGMHVVYVESVNGDGTVTVSEMNFKGRNVISSRTVPASTFQYIY